jgi:proteasome accessory factor B
VPVPFSLPDNPIRHWKVDRIEAVELTEFRFERPADFNLQEHFAGSFGVYQGDGDVQVKIRFSPTVARYVEEKTWHSTQRLARQSDGSLLASFRLDGVEEIKRWVLSFGQHAVVLEPEELRRAIAGELEAMRGAYGLPLGTGQNAGDGRKAIRPAPSRDGRPAPGKTGVMR